MHVRQPNILFQRLLRKTASSTPEDTYIPILARQLKLLGRIHALAPAPAPAQTHRRII
jgi:hypothetical protein